MGVEVVLQKSHRTGATTALIEAAIDLARHKGKQVLIVCKSQECVDRFKGHLERYEEMYNVKLPIDVQPFFMIRHRLSFHDMKVKGLPDHEVLMDHYAIESHFIGLLKQLKTQKPEIFQDEAIIHSPIKSRIMELFSDSGDDKNHQWQKGPYIPECLRPKFEEPAEGE